MNKILAYTIVALCITSCGMNNLFMHPYELTEASEFKQYRPEADDTLTLNFDAHRNPIFAFQGGGDYNPGYSITSVFFEGAKEHQLNAWVMIPDSAANGTSIFFMHGNAGNVVLNYQLAEPFVQRGYKVFLFDYTDFGFSEGKAKRKVILEDSKKALDYMLSRYEFEDEKIIVYGQSLGGHLAAVVGTLKQDLVDGMVIEGAFSNHKDIAGERVPVLGRIFVAEQYSATKTLPDFKKPLMIVHSFNDKTIPIVHGHRLYDCATAPKTFYEIDSAHVRGPLYFADSICAKMDRMLLQ